MKQDNIRAYIYVGQHLRHKYLSNITVVQVNDSGIMADTGIRGILPFCFSDFGKVIFFNGAHTCKNFDTFDDYLAYYIEDMHLRKVNEEKEKREFELRNLALQEKSEKNRIEKENRAKIILEFEREEKERLRKEAEQKAVVDRQLLEQKLLKEENEIKTTLNRVKKENIAEIRKIVETRAIKYIFHFTRVENLHSILLNGLVPVSAQNRLGISAVRNDDQRIDSKLNFTSCSISFPNYKLFYTFRDYKYPGTMWTVIVLDKDILFAENNILFCNSNAARILPRVSNLEKLCTANAFEGMFYGSIYLSEGRIVKRDSLELQDCMPTDPQSEILVSDIINPVYIRYVCFKNQTEHDEYMRIACDIPQGPWKFRISPKLFSPREDYSIWKKEC